MKTSANGFRIQNGLRRGQALCSLLWKWLQNASLGRPCNDELTLNAALNRHRQPTARKVCEAVLDAAGMEAGLEVNRAKDTFVSRHQNAGQSSKYLQC